MQLLGRLEIKSPQKIAEFLNSEHVGRIASLDKDGFPQIIPMNFAFVNNAIYMHSHTRGEKLDNIKNNQKVGFEVDKELEMALNALMEKYQPEGQYEKLTQDMHVVDEVAIIKVIPKTIKGKYKIGQHMDKESRINLARKILQKNSPTARKTIQVMGFDIIQNDVRVVDEPSW
ncbi:MAG: pyridoxamine 5'-phosphate oxidase family protein [Nitrososphaeria archaeon]|nr:pyridoxamine 5'-phosphate oxidase family protein [Nitrososphaeria archaeon]